jgi:PTS system nitrogen regulatory IIA component
MNLKKILSIETISLELPGETKDEVLKSLCELLYKSGKVKDKEAALISLKEREKKMSTGIQNNVAIPHGKSDCVDELVAAIAVKKEGIDFDSMDKEPSKIFVSTISPTHRTGPHLQFLAEVGELLTNKENREKIINATTREEILKIILG